MKCADLKVVSLNITEDNYEYKALFRLCTENVCADMDVAELSKDEVLAEIKKNFVIDEPVEEMRNIIMDKVMEASKLESRITEGESYNEGVKDKELQRKIDSLSKS